MAKLKFHLDEQVSRSVAEGLRRRGIDVTVTPDVGLRGESDLAQLEFAVEQGRVLFTQDDDFLALHQQGVEHCEIAYCHPRSRSIGEIVAGLVLMWEVLELEEVHNAIEFL
ncbi:MAG: hypothetical protein F6J87_09475 [Spirulina sp. SIO3F2]|nr:hypothetical protein [Spirulina sp. SIO3F2]